MPVVKVFVDSHPYIAYINNMYQEPVTTTRIYERRDASAFEDIMRNGFSTIIISVDGVIHYYNLVSKRKYVPTEVQRAIFRTEIPLQYFYLTKKDRKQRPFHVSEKELSAYEKEISERNHFVLELHTQSPSLTKSLLD